MNVGTQASCQQPTKQHAANASGESNKLNDLNQSVVDRVSGSEDKLASRVIKGREVPCFD